jgi:hypothetical protein
LEPSLALSCIALSTYLPHLFCRFSNPQLLFLFEEINPTTDRPTDRPTERPRLAPRRASIDGFSTPITPPKHRAAPNRQPPAPSPVAANARRDTLETRPPSSHHREQTPAGDDTLRPSTVKRAMALGPTRQWVSSIETLPPPLPSPPLTPSHLHLVLLCPPVHRIIPHKRLSGTGNTHLCASKRLARPKTSPGHRAPTFHKRGGRVVLPFPSSIPRTQTIREPPDLAGPRTRPP